MSETNQQKAKEIARGLNFASDYPHDYKSAYDGAILMAKYKDEQHEQEKQQWIDKACERLKKQAVGFWIDHLVYELKQAMKGE